MLKIKITEEERTALEQVVKTHEKAYMRERASAILQISQGKSGLQVALHGLLQKRRENTVYEWVRRYKAQGIEGLKNREGRGRKPSFFSK
jgi:transposase